MLEVTNEIDFSSKDQIELSALKWAVELTGKEITSLLEKFHGGSASSREVARFEHLTSFLVLATKPRMAEIIEAWIKYNQIASASMLANATGLPRQTCREKMLHLFRRKIVKKARIDQLINTVGLDIDNNGLSSVVFYTDESLDHIDTVIEYLFIHCSKALTADSYNHVVCVECITTKNRAFNGQPCKECHSRGFTTAYFVPLTSENHDELFSRFCEISRRVNE